MALTKVSSSLVSDNAVTSGKIADGGIATADIADVAVTTAKIANNAILTQHIDDGQVTTAQLGADAVTAAKIANDAISEEHLDVTVITGLTEVTAATGDLLMVADISDSNNLKKIPVSSILAGTLTNAAQTNITSLGTLTSLNVDTMTLNGSSITGTSNLTLDVTGDITLNADGGDWLFYDGAVTLGSIQNDGNNNLVLMSNTNDKDIKFLGIDNSNTITALLLDMSNAGAARFNGSIIIEKNARVLEIADAAIQWYSAETSDYKSALFRADDYSFKNAGNSVVATISSTGAITSSSHISAEDNIWLTDAGTVRAKLLLNSSDRDNVELRAESLGSTMKFFTVGTQALLLDASQNATFAGTISSGAITSTGNLLINESGNTERSLRIQSSSATAYFGVEGSSANRFVGSSANNMFLGTTTADGIEFATNNTVRATINSSGNATFNGTISSGEMSATNYKVGSTQIVTSGRSIQNIVNYVGTGEIQISGNLQATHVYNSGSYYVLNQAGNGWNTVVNRGNGNNFTVNTLSGFTVDGTTVIDSSKNLTNINTATLSSTTSMLLTLNPTANNYGGIAFQYGGVTKGTSIYNSGMMVYGGESSVSTALQAGGQYGLFIHHSTRAVGIGTGTTSPVAKLEIKGSGGGTELSLKTTDASANETFFVQDGGRVGVRYWPLTVGIPSSTAAATSAKFQVEEDGLLTVLTNGNVGIGTAAPTSLLHLNKSSTNSDVDMLKLLMPSWSQSQQKLKSIVWHDGTNNVAAIGSEFDGGKVNLHFHSQYNGGYSATSTRTMSILGDGHVCVATSTPQSSAKLTVNGGIRFNHFSAGHGLNCVSNLSFNNSNTANACGTVYYKMFVLNLYHNNGHSQTLFLANGGGGVGFRFTTINAGDNTIRNGIVDFNLTTIGSSPNTFRIQISNGGGALTVSRTSGTGSFGVNVMVLAGG